MAKWIFLPRSALRWVGPQMTRRVKRHNTVPLHLLMAILTFLLTKPRYVISTTLSGQCKNGAIPPQSGGFRASAWEEDRWKVIRIGDVVFEWLNLVAAVFSPPSAQKKGKTSGRRTIKNIAIFPHCPG